MLDYNWLYLRYNCCDLRTVEKINKLTQQDAFVEDCFISCLFQLQIVMLQGLAVRYSQAIFTDESVHVNLFSRRAVIDAYFLVCLTALSNAEVIEHQDNM
jgi:hypothetical protein